MRILDKSYDLQGIFDTCVTHLRKQGVRSETEVVIGGKKAMLSMYRSPDGKCAAGIFIPDELYDPSHERKRIGILLYKLTGVYSAAEFSLLDALQEIHDEKFVSEWEAEWLILADRFGLMYREVRNVKEN